MTNDAREPIFILSSVRSGSTLLRCIIDTHPNICSPGHLDLGMLCNDLYISTYYSIGNLPFITTNNQREQISIKETQDVVNHLMDRYVKGKGKIRWCEKSTINVDHLDILYKTFPHAKYVCLYRNCLDVSYSCIKSSTLGYMDELSTYIKKYPTDFVKAMVENWLEKSKKIIQFEESHRNQSFRVSYEALVCEPERVLDKLFNFLGESWNQELIDAIFKMPHDQGNGDVKVWFSNKINSDSVGVGTSIPMLSIPPELVEEVNILHEQLGYPTIENFYSGHSFKMNQSVHERSINDFFNNHFLHVFSESKDKFNVPRGTCKFVVTGREGGIWTVKSDNNGISLSTKDSLADCTISTTDTIFYEMLQGNKNAVEAYEKGEIVGDGNVNMALEFGRIMFGGI